MLADISLNILLVVLVNYDNDNRVFCLVELDFLELEMNNCISIPKLGRVFFIYSFIYFSILFVDDENL